MTVCSTRYKRCEGDIGRYNRLVNRDGLGAGCVHIWCVRVSNFDATCYIMNLRRTTPFMSANLCLYLA